MSTQADTCLVTQEAECPGLVARFMHTTVQCHTFLKTWDMILLVACISSVLGCLRFEGFCICDVVLGKLGVEGVGTGLTKGSKSLCSLKKAR